MTATSESAATTDTVDSAGHITGDGAASWTRNWRLFLLAALITALSVLAMDEADPDLWGHVQYGQEFLEEGRLETRSTWNYTALGYRWVNHENLAEIALAAADWYGGGTGLIVLKLAVSLLLLGVVVWRLAARGTHPLTIGIVLVVLAQSIAFHWHFRPQIFGYALFAVRLALLDWCFQGWAGAWWARIGWNSSDPATPRTSRTWFTWWSVPSSQTPDYSWFRMRQLYWLLPLGIVWVNTHGSFAAGVCVACTYLGLRGLESLFIYRSNGWGRFRRFLLVSLGVLVVVLVNPYGYRLITWLLEDVYLPRPEIEDWERLPLFTAEGIGFWLMLSTSLLATWRTRRGDFTHTVILLLLTWQSVSHIRHLVWLAIAWSFWMSGPLDELVRGFGREIAAQRPPGTPGTTRPSPLVTGLLCLWMAYVGVMFWPRVSQLKVDRGVYPVAALNFLAEHGLSGRTVVTFNWAQYALHCFAASDMPSKVAVDGRLRTCYPQEVIDIYFDFLFGLESDVPRYRSPNSGPLDPTLALRYESPELVLISRRQQPSVQVMEQHQDTWTLLYQDSLAQVWGRRDLFDDPHGRRYFPIESRQITNAPQHGYAAWPATPQVDHITSPQQLPIAVAEGDADE